MKKDIKQLVIKIEELPKRTEDLGYSILQKIYGGDCKSNRSFCCDDSECCSKFCLKKGTSFYCWDYNKNY